MDRPHDSHAAGASAPMPRRPRRWPWVLGGILLLLAMPLCAPYALGLGPVRRWFEARLSAGLGTQCSIGRLSFSWFQGIRIEEFTIGNPPGFPTERPALRLRHASLGWLRPLGWGARGLVDGLEIWVEQRADGMTNLQALAGEPVLEWGTAPDSPAPSPAPRRPQRADEPPFGLSFALRAARLEFRREGRLLEAAYPLDVELHHPPRATRTELTAAVQLLGGRASCAASFDWNSRTARFELATPGFELGAWQPLLAALWPEAGQTTFAGIVSGRLVADADDAGGFALAGELVVDQPRLASQWLGEGSFGSPRWTIAPDLSFAPDRPGAGLGLGQSVLDLDWLIVRGAPPPGGEAAHWPGLRFDLDLAGLARAGAPVPDWLARSAARVDGELSLASAALPVDLDGWLGALAATMRFVAPGLVIGDLEFADVGAHVAVRGGTMDVALADGVRLAGGPLSLRARIDLRDAAHLPATASLRWQGGRLEGATAKVLRYAAPVLGGLADAAAPAGRCDLALELSGPVLGPTDASWLRWLDQWRGSGEVAMREVKVAPAPALRPLLAPFPALAPLGLSTDALGRDGLLLIDSLAAPFSFATGSVRTTAASWLAKGRRIGLHGSVRFDGALDYELDLSDLLRGHRDGERVLQLLSGALPPALLSGSIDAPRLAMPPLDGVAQRLLEQQLGQRIEQQGKDVLRRALDDLLRRKP